MPDAITTASCDDPLMAVIRPAIREAIEQAVEAELAAALGAARYERLRPRLGYRNGTQGRIVGTPMGAIPITVPRARVATAATTQEWHSAALPRYQRRLRRLDDTILGVYLSGTNQRKIAAALRPLLTGVALSKSAVSRLAGQLQLAREEWMQRRLEEERCVYLYLDGFVVPVRRDGRVTKAPLLIVVGVRDTGERLLLAMRIATGESAAGWRSVLDDLGQRVGHDLLTFYAFPSDQWKALRRTNLIERIHGELRRRIKTQATWSTEHGMLNLLHGLLAAGIIRLRRIDGFTTLRAAEHQEAA